MRKTLRAFTRFQPAEGEIIMVIRGLRETYWLFGFIPVYRVEKMIDWNVATYPVRMIKQREY